ncbi:hypothetical protein ACP70R_033985 [Stipagrostis hirtigluma subsp. patula]
MAPSLVSASGPCVSWALCLYIFASSSRLMIADRDRQF